MLEISTGSCRACLQRACSAPMEVRTGWACLVEGHLVPLNEILDVPYVDVHPSPTLEPDHGDITRPDSGPHCSGCEPQDFSCLSLGAEAEDQAGLP